MRLSPTRSTSEPVLAGSRRDVPPATAIRLELQKVLESEAFREAEGLKRFLRYTVEHTLRGEGDQLKEYRLGLEVFDRDSSFDPRLDPVVRMAARRLRTKLRQYYDTEGLRDPVWIAVPKGSYAAEFSYHNAELHATQAPLEAVGTRPGRSWRIPQFVLVSVAITAAALLAGWTLSRRGGRTAAEVSPQIHSVAVLPLRNLSGDPHQEYLSDGITEELITDLAQVRSLRVISRTSAMTYKGTNKRLPEIAQELNVDAIVEGSVMRSGKQVQVTAQLIDARTDTHLWAQTYAGEFNDLLSLQNQVAQAVVQQVGVKLTAEEQGRLTTIRLVSPEAHEEYLLGRYYWNKRTTDGFAKAVEYFQQASARNPRYALAYAGLADCYVLQAEYTLQPSQQVLPKAREAALRALQLDDALAEAHASLAAAKLDYEWDWAGAEQELRRAIELNAGYATAHQWYAELLAEEGRSSEAIAEIKRARELDPLSLIVNAMQGRILLFAGLDDEAIDQLHKTLELDSDFNIANYDLGKAYLRKGDLRQATDAFQKSAKLKVAERIAALAYIYAQTGRNAEARNLMAGYIRQPRSDYVSWYAIAIFYAGLGEKDQSFASLERAYLQHDSRLRDLKQEPLFAGLHADSRFAGLIQRLRL